MASACVMLDGDVRLVARNGESAGAGGTCFPEFWVAEETCDKSVVPSVDDGPLWFDEDEEEEEEEVVEVKPKGLVDWVREGLVRVAIDKLVTHPKIYTLSLQLPADPREIVAELHSVSIVSADKNLLVLHTGPQWNYFSSFPKYMVYDVAAADLFVAPPVDSFNLFQMSECHPVVMRTGEGTGDFTLAILLRSHHNRQCFLSQWSPSKGQQWLRKLVCLPKDVVQFDFTVDVAFAFQGQWACWIDLNLGILTCDLLLTDPQFKLKLLPTERSSYRGHPDAYNTVGCVDGKLKYLYVHGFDVDRDGEVPIDKITINNWTLVGEGFPDQCMWVKHDNMTLSLGDLWGDESFRACPGLPKFPPYGPVLSPMEPDVVYFILNDVCRVDGRVTTKGQYVLSLNLHSKKVQSSIKIDCFLGSLRMYPSLVAAEICAYKEPPNLDDQETSSHTMIPETSFLMSCNVF